METQNTLTLEYRPSEIDDWGVIREKKSGQVYAVARYADETPESLDEHRKNGTDPCQEKGERIVRACNSHDALVEVAKWAVGCFECGEHLVPAHLYSDAKEALKQAGVK